MLGQPDSGMWRTGGFTLIELLITIGVAAVLMGVAIPSFMTSIERNKERAVLDTLTTSIKYARSEAVKRNRQLLVCTRNATSTGCVNSTDWAGNGWLLLLDNPDPAPDEVLRVWDLQGGVVTLTAPAQIEFNPDGTLGAPSALVVKSGDQETHNLCVSLTGSIFEGACP